MPNFFCLMKKGDETKTPVKFTEVDEEMCKHFGVEPDPVKYYDGWYDWIGFCLAAGASFAEIRKPYEVPNPDEFRQRTLAIIDWLDANYVSSAWASN